MKLGIIGGGASGLVAAISAAREGAHVTVLEGGERIGRKILATGNGKCNFTNENMSNDCYRSNSIEDISSFLEAFGTKECLRFFEELGMLYKVKRGCYYPYSEQASTVLDALRFEIDNLKEHILVLTEQKANAVSVMADGQVRVACKTNTFTFDRVILACGSKASPKTGSDGTGYRLLRSLDPGLHIVEPVPALVQLCAAEDYLKAVSGVRMEGRVSLYIDGRQVCEDLGEIQLTDYGVSGIPVFQISRYASYGVLQKSPVEVILDAMPYADRKAFAGQMWQRKEKLQDRTAEQLVNGLLNKKVAALFCRLSGISMEQPVRSISEKQWKAFIKLCKEWKLTIKAVKGFDMAQICAGGLSMQEINSHFALKKHPSVYAAGELLDVDGICGGYNLQWAWTSGYLAGKYAALDKDKL